MLTDSDQNIVSEPMFLEVLKLIVIFFRSPEFPVSTYRTESSETSYWRMCSSVPIFIQNALKVRGILSMTSFGYSSF